MAILERRGHKITIDLATPRGSAFALIHQAEMTAKQLNYSECKINSILDEMQAGDYENLIKVFDREFGEYIDLVR